MSVASLDDGGPGATSPLRCGAPRSTAARPAQGITGRCWAARPSASTPLADVPAHRAGRQTPPPCACLHEWRAAEGRRPADHEFLSLLAKSEPPPGWNLDEGGCFLLLPLAERDRAWVTRPCRDDTERGWHAFPGGEAVAFARGRDFALTRVLAL